MPAFCGRVPREHSSVAGEGAPATSGSCGRASAAQRAALLGVSGQRSRCRPRPHPQARPGGRVQGGARARVPGSDPTAVPATRPRTAGCSSEASKGESPPCRPAPRHRRRLTGRGLTWGVVAVWDQGTGTAPGQGRGLGRPRPHGLGCPPSPPSPGGMSGCWGPRRGLSGASADARR